MISLSDDRRLEDVAGDAVVVVSDEDEVDEVADYLDRSQEDADARYHSESDVHFDRVLSQARIGQFLLIKIDHSFSQDDKTFFTNIFID